MFVQPNARPAAPPPCLFLPVATSYLELLAVAQQAKANAACAEADAVRPGDKFIIRCHVYFSPTPHLPISYCAGTVSTPVGGAAAEEGRDATSALDLFEVDGDGMDEATRATIEFACEGD